jgi:hypothetical protein
MERRNTRTEQRGILTQVGNSPPFAKRAKDKAPSRSLPMRHDAALHFEVADALEHGPDDEREGDGGVFENFS